MGVGKNLTIENLVRIPTPIQLARFSTLVLWQKENQLTSAKRLFKNRKTE